ncbi:MAG: glycosyltransferase family 2 protein [Microgenomates group bacterium]
MKKVGIVVLHYKGKNLTDQCFKFLNEINIKNYQIIKILVDNCSPEPVDYLRKKFKDLKIIKNSQNLGFAEGNNVGIRYALKNGADYILILNNDTTVDKNFLIYLIKQSDLINKSGIFGPKIYFAPCYEYHKNRYKKEERGKVFWYAGGLIDWKNIYCSHRGVDEVDRGQYDKVEETDFVSGCAMLVKREVFEKVGLFDPRYFLYLEDVDFCVRAKKAGFKIIYVPQAKVWHYNAGSSEVGGSLHDYFITRNRMLFGIKYASLRTKIALIKESFKIFLKGRKWQKIAIRDFYFQKFGKGSWID